MGGVILDCTVKAYKGIAVFQPVINGVGGNLVAVQASKLSTWLHQRGRLEHSSINNPSDSNTSFFCVSPVSTFCTGGPHAKTARVLLLLVRIQSLSFYSVELTSNFCDIGPSWACYLHACDILSTSGSYQPYSGFLRDIHVLCFSSSMDEMFSCNLAPSLHPIESFFFLFYFIN